MVGRPPRASRAPRSRRRTDMSAPLLVLHSRGSRDKMCAYFARVCGGLRTQTKFAPNSISQPCVTHSCAGSIFSKVKSNTCGCPACSCGNIAVHAKGGSGSADPPVVGPFTTSAAAAAIHDERVTYAAATAIGDATRRAQRAFHRSSSSNPGHCSVRDCLNAPWCHNTRRRRPRGRRASRSRSTGSRHCTGQCCNRSLSATP